MNPNRGWISGGLLWITLAAGLSACGVDLNPITEAPPTRVADLDPANETIELSNGVALGVSCTDSCDGACENAEVLAADPEILSVRDALAPTVDSPWFEVGDVWVLLGSAPGRTELTVRSDCGEQVYAVEVLDD